MDRALGQGTIRQVVSDLIGLGPVARRLAAEAAIQRPGGIVTDETRPVGVRIRSASDMGVFPAGGHRSVRSFITTALTAGAKGLRLQEPQAAIRYSEGRFPARGCRAARNSTVNGTDRPPNTEGAVVCKKARTAIRHSEGRFSAMHSAIRQTEGTHTPPTPVKPLNPWPNVTPYVTVTESSPALSLPYSISQTPKSALGMRYADASDAAGPDHGTYSPSRQSSRQDPHRTPC